MLACYIDFISEDGNMIPVELRSKDDFGSDDKIFSEDFSAIILPKDLTEDLSRIESAVTIYLLSLIAAFKIAKIPDKDFGYRHMRPIRITHYHFGSSNVKDAIDYLEENHLNNKDIAYLVSKLRRTFPILKSDLFFADKNNISVFDVKNGHMPNLVTII